jgi:hypothetical protein
MVRTLSLLFLAAALGASACASLRTRQDEIVPMPYPAAEDAGPDVP